MEKEFTEVYCGSGKGKTTLAVGQCLKASANGKSVIIIQFLKGKERRELDFLEELENQDIKIFRFEKKSQRSFRETAEGNLVAREKRTLRLNFKKERKRNYTAKVSFLSFFCPGGKKSPGIFLRESVANPKKKRKRREALFLLKELWYNPNRGTL